MLARRLKLAAWGVLLLAAASLGGAAENPRRVLILYSFEPGFVLWDAIATGLRTELERRAPGRLHLFETSLLSAQVGDVPGADADYVRYLNGLFASRPLDLVITVGAPAARFVAANRAGLFAQTPVLYAAADRRAIGSGLRTPNDAIAMTNIDIPKLVGNILKVQPGTDQIAWIFGGSPIERFWSAQVRQLEPQFGGRVRFTWYDGLSFDEIRQRVAALPPHSAVFFALLSTSVAGIPQSETDALESLHAVATAPIFSYVDSYFGKGVVGGPMLSVAAGVRAAADSAMRVLEGTPPAAIPEVETALGRPRYDWRELRRWHLREADLPPGSSIEFRTPSAWEQYRALILGTAGLLLIESALIVGLLYERRQRRLAEHTVRLHFAELAHMNRRAVAHELSASIAHELSQPLAAILSNAEAAESMLEGPAPDWRELRVIVADIQRDDRRASDVLGRIRTLLARGVVKPRLVEINGLMREVLDLLAGHAGAVGIRIEFEPAPEPVEVNGDRVQLQQVVLNLMMNAIDAVQQGATHGRRRVAARVETQGEQVEIAVSDSGAGLAAVDPEKVFEPFYTTKAGSMGMGLAIARRIVEQHGGRIAAAPGAPDGAVFRVLLPRAASSATRLGARQPAVQPA